LIPQGYKKTKIGLIPKKWKVEILEKVVEFRNGCAHEKSITDHGKYIVINSKFISSDGKILKYTNVNLCPLYKGNIVMVMSDLPKGKALAKCFFVDRNGTYTLNQRICSFKTIKVFNKFLYYFLNRNRYFLSFDNGVEQTNLRKDEVLGCPVALPPLLEQQKIAEILSTVDADIEKTDTIIKETQQLKRGLMGKLLTEGIGHTRFKKTKIGRIPEEWDIIPLGKTADKAKYSFTGGPFGSNLKSEEYTEKGVRIIQLQNIGVGKFLDDYKIFTSREKADELKSCNIYPGDIVIAKMAEPVARACIMPTCDQRYLMASDGIRLSVDKKKYDTSYIQYAINSVYFRKTAERHGTGTTRLRIGLSELKKLPIAIPPLPEQQEIVSILSEVDAKIENEQSHKSELEQLKKGLLQVLLTGKVRVKV
jgi:type I restriction enzyme S subunit